MASVRLTSNTKKESVPSQFLLLSAWNQRLRPGPLKFAFQVGIALEPGRDHPRADIDFVAFQRVTRPRSLDLSQHCADVCAVSPGDGQRLAFFADHRFAG